ncbi:dihydrofolate reductase family protein [Agromyces sp. NPDC049794]|uniref:dihydrofolate reductase family protein n=1 Tax=unclassified Agromyces TaxID=2639701 RepID=UPI0033FCD09C
MIERTMNSCSRTDGEARRKVVVYSLISLDGVAEEPGDWMFEVDSDVFSFLSSVIEEQDDVLLGRGTYDYWVDYWPTSVVEPFASFINSVPKHVFSSTPLRGIWNNERLADRPLEEHVRAMRGDTGRDIGVHGSITLVQALLAASLVDELHLVVAPTIAGHGARLFPSGVTGPLRLTCTMQSRTPSGALLASYSVVDAPRA